MRILALLATLLLLSGCAGHGQVDELRGQAVAQWSRPGLREVGGFTNGPGRPLGMPRYAQVLRILEVHDGSDARSVVAEVRAVATRTGWSMRSETDDSFTAEKTLTVDGEELRVELGAGRQTLPGEPGPVQVYVSLTAYPA
jgi:hypothetical protein